MNRTPADTTEHAAHSWGKHGICTHCGTSPEMAEVFPRCLPYGWEGDEETRRITEEAIEAGRAWTAYVAAWHAARTHVEEAATPRQLSLFDEVA